MAEDRTPRRISLAEPTADPDDVQLVREHRRLEQEERVRRHRDPDHSAVSDVTERLGESSGHDTPGSRMF